MTSDCLKSHKLKWMKEGPALFGGSERTQQGHSIAINFTIHAPVDEIQLSRLCLEAEYKI